MVSGRYRCQEHDPAFDPFSDFLKICEFEFFGRTMRRTVEVSEKTNHVADVGVDKPNHLRSISTFEGQLTLDFCATRRFSAARRHLTIRICSKDILIGRPSF